MNLYEKYRPKNFSEVIGQDIPIKILKHLIDNPKSHHAILLTGIHGVGKTSLARLFAKTINCLQQENNLCNACENCLELSSVDIIEIDGATYTSVENIRQIIEDSNYLPVKFKYKIYIIDEVHMISKNAFNSLLKTLEKPPEHVKFVFATTEKYKIPDTILSRCLIIPLSKINNSALELKLTMICKEENKMLNSHTIQQIISLSNGSVRDSISFLEIAFKLFDHNQEKDFFSYIKILSDNQVIEILELILQGNCADAINLWENMESVGYDPKNFLNKMLEILFNVFMAKNYNKTQDSLDNILKYKISNGLIVGFQEILLTQLEALFNDGKHVVHNAIMMMTILDDTMDLSKFIKRSFSLKS